MTLIPNILFIGLLSGALLGCARDTKHTTLTGQQAEKLAVAYAHAQGLHWPATNKIEKYSDVLHLLVKDGRGHWTNASVTGGFLVYKGIAPKEIYGLGYEMVVVSFDGRMIGMAPLE